MNENVRTYLIEVARQKDKLVYYSQFNVECNLGLDLSNKGDLQQLRKIMEEVSIYENTYGRPLLSSLLIYKDPAKNDHGDGFYKLAEKLGKGPARKLKEELYGFTEAENCRKFWQSQDNYKQFASITTLRAKTIADLFVQLTDSEEYEWADDWTTGYLDFVNQVTLLRQAFLQNPNHPIDFAGYYQNLHPDLDSYKGFMLRWLKEQSNGISSRGQSILSANNFNKVIYNDAFKIIAKQSILQPTAANFDALTNWWYSNLDIGNRPLLINRAFAACLPELLSSTVDNNKFWKVIEIVRASYGFEFTEDHQDSWYLANIQLTNWLNKELGNVLPLRYSNTTEQHIRRNIFVWLIYADLIDNGAYPPNTLHKKEKPSGGFESFPPTKGEFKGKGETDYVARAKALKDLGDAGEYLVKEYEKKLLELLGLHSLAHKVDIVKDGEGYDIISFDVNGNDKFIEVKTTTGGELTPFYLSENEVNFMRVRQGSYCIYRVYNYDEEYNCGDFFEISDDVEAQLLMKPVQYQVLLKKES